MVDLTEGGALLASGKNGTSDVSLVINRHSLRKHDDLRGGHMITINRATTDCTHGVRPYARKALNHVKLMMQPSLFGVYAITAMALQSHVQSISNFHFAVLS